MKTLKMLFIHSGFVFIILGISIICIDKVSANIKNYYDDLEKSKEIQKSVNEQYQVFKEGASKVKSSIGVVSSSFNFYLEEFDTKNIEILEKVSNVEKEIEELNETAKLLTNNCKYNLNNNVMNNECSSFKINYKNMISSYDEMVEKYNSVIDYYNEYAKKNNKEIVNKYLNNLSDNVKEMISENM